MAAVATQRFHGRNGKLFVGIASASAAPSPVAYISAFQIDMTTEKADGTAFGDANKTYLAGLPDDKGSFSGFSDLAGDALYTAARDGAARKFYFYPDYTNAQGTYFHGAAFFDLSSSFAVGDGAKVSGNWVASSDINRVLQS